MNNKELYKKTIDMIELMAKNRFLLPDSCSQEVFLESGKKYKTYVDAQSRSYIIFYLFSISGEQLFDIKLSRKEIRIEGIDIFNKVPTAKEIHDTILEIYTEKHSFQGLDEGKKKLIEQISNKYTSLKSIKEEINKLESSLSGLNNIK